MAIVTRYFSTTGAGAADGTTWADRAALFSAGNWSTVITGFAFNGTDSLVCRIEGGLSYTCSQQFVSGLFANPPTVANPLFLVGCDSSGNILSGPDPGWRSCEPDWDASTLPTIATTTNISTIALANTFLHLLKLTASGRNGAIVSTATGVNWCHIVNSTANASAQATSVNSHNCVLKCTGSSYDAVALTAILLFNCRIEGVTGSSGDRRGFEGSTGTTDHELINCTIVNNGGAGVYSPSTNVSGTLSVRNCVIANNGAGGIVGNATASQTDFHTVRHCMVTGNGGYGVDSISEAAKIFAYDNRLRDNTSGNFGGFTNYPTDLNNYTTDAADADDYVDAANGDFRIKNTAAIHGMGFGVADEPAADGGGSIVFVQRPGVHIRR